MVPGSNGKYWYSKYHVTQTLPTTTIESSNSSNTGSFTFDTPTLGHNFSGLVTFSSGTLTDGSSSFDPDDKLEAGQAAADINNNVTTINGGKITANSLSVNRIQSSTQTIGTHTFGFATTGITIAGTSYDTTGLFTSADTGGTCAALTAINTGNTSTSVGFAAASKSGAVAGFYKDSGGVWNDSADSVVKIGDGNNAITILKNGTESFRVRSDGHTVFGGGYGSTGITLQSDGTGYFNGNIIVDGSGNFANVTATGNVTAYSDAKLKENLQVIPNALEKVQTLTGYTFDRIDTGEAQTGLIAQDVQKILPEAVSEQDGTLTLAYGNLVGLLVEAIKELKEEVEELKRGTSD